MSSAFKNFALFLCGKLYRGVVLSKYKEPIMPFYAVARGRTPGIFMNWSDCESQVKGHSGARYKKFDTISEAEQFINAEGGSQATSSSTKSTNSGPSFYSNPNLKRAFSTSSKHEKYSEEPSFKPPKQRKSTKRNAPENEPAYSDDMSAALVKQMDYIEKELSSFKKGIDKIYGQTQKTQKKTKLINLPSAAKRNDSTKEFMTDSNGYVQVFTDGACSANGKKGARAGLGVYWGDKHHLNVSEPVSGRATNNCGEIQAATRAIKQAIDNGITNLSINTDSQFVINAATKWMPAWKRKGWKLASGDPVKNEVDFKDLDSVKNKINIKWNYIEAHKGHHGNEMADRLAKDGAARASARSTSTPNYWHEKVSVAWSWTKSLDY